jgi:hypothetical protein
MGGNEDIVAGDELESYAQAGEIAYRPVNSGLGGGVGQNQESDKDHVAFIVAHDGL